MSPKMNDLMTELSTRADRLEFVVDDNQDEKLTQFIVYGEKQKAEDWTPEAPKFESTVKAAHLMFHEDEIADLSAKDIKALAASKWAEAAAEISPEDTPA